MNIYGSSTKDAPEQSFDVRINAGGPHLDYVWNGRIPSYPFDDNEASRRTNSLLLVVVGIALPIIVLIAVLFVDFVFIYLFLAMAILISIFMEAFNLPYLLNKTSFQLQQGTLFVSTRPLPLQRSRSVRRYEIRYLDASYYVSPNYGPRGSYSWTSIYVERTDGSHVVLLKVEGVRADMFRLAKALRKCLDIQEKKESPRKQLVPTPSGPPEGERMYVR